MPFDLKLNHKTPIIEPIMLWDMDTVLTKKKRNESC